MVIKWPRSLSTTPLRIGFRSGSGLGFGLGLFLLRGPALTGTNGHSRRLIPST